MKKLNIPFKRVVTNGDRIRVMTDEELEEFLSRIAYGGDWFWDKAFDREFCDHCPTVEGTVRETGETMEFHECEFADGKCPHGSTLGWWLRQPKEAEGAGG